MSINLTGIIICDSCYVEEEFVLPGFHDGITEVHLKAERKGWQCDAEDLCPEYVAEQNED